MDSAQVQTVPTRVAPEPMVMALIKLLAQPTLKPMTGGKHVRAGVTKNKMVGESKARRKIAKASRARNRGR